MGGRRVDGGMSRWREGGWREGGWRGEDEWVEAEEGGHDVTS